MSISLRALPMSHLILSPHQHNILMALIVKIISETWARARPLGVLLNVHSDIWLLGAGRYIKESEQCGCIV